MKVEDITIKNIYATVGVGSISFHAEIFCRDERATKLDFPKFLRVLADKLEDDNSL